MNDPDDYGDDFTDVLQEQRELEHDADCRRRDIRQGIEPWRCPAMAEDEP